MLFFNMLLHFARISIILMVGSAHTRIKLGGAFLGGDASPTVTS